MRTLTRSGRWSVTSPKLGVVTSDQSSSANFFRRKKCAIVAFFCQRFGIDSEVKKDPKKPEFDTHSTFQVGREGLVFKLECESRSSSSPLRAITHRECAICSHKCYDTELPDRIRVINFKVIYVRLCQSNFFMIP